MKNNEIKIDLPNVDDLFKVGNNTERVIRINTKEISDFPNHPYKVKEDDEMLKMVETIKEGGVILPALVRQKEDGSYEMISGHRRKKATELAGIKDIPCIVRQLTDDEATILMVDSNIQRTKILYSEKAFAYKMRYDAQKHQGKRSDLTSAPLVQKLDGKTTREKLAEEVGESHEQIRRYIRLTELIPEILEMVDEEKVAFRPAVEISYLKEDEQYTLLDNIQMYDATPSLAQSIHMKKLSGEGKLTADKIDEIMGEEKPNQIPKVKINEDRLRTVLPNHIKTGEEIENFVIACIKEHNQREKNKILSR